jgi:DNA-binding IclR family transcriptional regulator
MQPRPDRHLKLAEIAVADALQELAEAGQRRPTVGQMAQRLGMEPSRASRMTAPQFVWA